MKEGWNADGSLIYEKTGDRVRNNLDWWPQAESVVAFLNAWQISNDQTFLDASVKTWNWIKNNLIDREYGEWYSVVLANGTPIKSRAKADMWRCPYHNSRMGFEILSRIK
jgi:mannobiose 2-epimerase